MRSRLLSIGLPRAAALRLVVSVGAACLAPPPVSAAPSGAPVARAVDPSKAPASVPPWCAPELDVLADGVCFSRPSAPTGVSGSTSAQESPATLVIFLHSLVSANTDWQWQQQRMLARSGEKNGYSVLFPRGRLGIGPGRDPNTWAWPGSAEAQRLHEEEVISEWMAHQRALEERDGPFDQVFVFGFSNGAYYATNLAMRGRVRVHGYGVFAGGSGSKYHRILGQQTDYRVPVFVGYGTKDPDHPRQRALVELLRSLRWPYRQLAAPVGHMATDSQLDAAISFLRDTRGAAHKTQTAEVTRSGAPQP